VAVKTFRINVAAERSGISTDLVRAWERRYGVLKPKRTPSGYRVYSEGDVEVLRRLKEATDGGMSIAEAVKLLPDIKRTVRKTRRAPTEPVTSAQLELWSRRVLNAAAQLDQEEVGRILDEAMTAMEPVVLFDSLLAPLERIVGERWHAGTLSVAEEHLVTNAVRQRTMVLLLQAPKGTKRHVVCACFPNEEHELGVLGAALRFRHAGWRVTLLGGRTPPEHLARTIDVTRPDLVALSAIYDEGRAAFRQTLREMMAGHQGVRFVIGGRAAELHSDDVKKAGAMLVRPDTPWRDVLGE